MAVARRTALEYAIAFTTAILWLSALLAVNAVTNIPRLGENIILGSRLPLAIMGDPGDSVLIIDEAPLYGATFPYYIMPLAIVIDVNTSGFKNVNSVKVLAAHRTVLYLVDSSSPTLHETPYIISSASTRSLLEKLGLYTISEVAAKPYDNLSSARMIIPVYRLKESYTPRYIIMILAHGENTSICLKELGCGKAVQLIDKAYTILKRYSSQPARRAPLAEIASLIRYKLALLYSIYGYPHVVLRIKTSYIIENPLPLILFVALLIAIAVTAVLAAYRITYIVPSYRFCENIRPPIAWYTRRSCRFIFLGSTIGIIMLNLHNYWYFILPLSSAFLASGILLWLKGFAAVRNCSKKYFVAWLSAITASSFLAASTALLLASLLVPGSFMIESSNLVYRSSLIPLALTALGLYEYRSVRKLARIDLFMILLALIAPLSFISLVYALIALTAASIVGCIIPLRAYTHTY